MQLKNLYFKSSPTNICEQQQHSIKGHKKVACDSKQALGAI